MGVLRRNPLSVDKAAAQAMLQSIVKEVEHRKAGILDPIDETMRVPFVLYLPAAAEADTLIIGLVFARVVATLVSMGRA